MYTKLNIHKLVGKLYFIICQHMLPSARTHENLGARTSLPDTNGV